ncbi:MAG TPA: SRPBCC family protein [Burkholderiales bacterium]|jgi:uncharacterized protein YndB with AHSA1/START domain|nr:SRPBCC family protein [Burkholderiales bacterium]
MTKPEFIYTTYIKTTPEKLWAVITNPEFTRQYWGKDNVSDWKKGSKWQSFTIDDSRTVVIAGEVLESVPAKRLVLTWASPDDAADVSQVTFEIEPVGNMVRLIVIHGNFTKDSNMASRVAAGWPLVLSSMKSFLETGKALDIWAGKESGCATLVAKGVAA